MAENQGLPIEVGVEKAKSELVMTIARIGEKYKLPSAIMTMIVDEIACNSKLNTYATVIAYCDLIAPKPPQTPEPMANDDVDMGTAKPNSKPTGEPIQEPAPDPDQDKSKAPKIVYSSKKEALEALEPKSDANTKSDKDTKSNMKAK